jgi:very-short-patch-repair endonuclease
MPNENARHLRRAATDAERRLWSALRDRRLEGYRFRRQYPIGRFIVDFACTQHRLIVEADGGQHADSEPDRRRTANLEQEGWRVLRFWNNDILSNTNGVVEKILRELRGESDPHPPTPLAWAPPSPVVRERG